MAQMAKRRPHTTDPALGDSRESTMRDQEVLRANKELAAYFRGQRTEREARGALKTIKAFIRDRERTPSAKRRPLPGLETPIRPPSKPTRVKPRKTPRREAESERPVTVDTSEAAGE